MNDLLDTIQQLAEEYKKSINQKFNGRYGTAREAADLAALREGADEIIAKVEELRSYDEYLSKQYPENKKPLAQPETNKT